jgi:hypothetical protein
MAKINALSVGFYSIIQAPYVERVLSNSVYVLDACDRVILDTLHV